MPSADAFDFDADPALQDIYWRDEILQLMYWLKGEGLLEEVTADDLRRFLATDPGRLEARLDQLVQEGYLEPASEGIRRYRLSTCGVDEGRRRFVDEFTPFLGRESHLECGDPACECHTSGAACPRLQGRQEASQLGGRDENRRRGKGWIGQDHAGGNTRQDTRPSRADYPGYRCRYES